MTQIITQIQPNLHSSWQKELANVVTDPEKLLTLLEIDPNEYKAHFKARSLFPVRVPYPFIKKMHKGDFNDPLLRQVMPLNQEFDMLAGYSSDPLEEHDTVAEGLLHKYQHRVLMIVKSGCAINCRYCFRRHFPYQDNSPNKSRWQQALDYIKVHNEINEVIFSGGDPLMANDEHLNWLINAIEQIPHITRLRIHTRMPVSIPQRITKSFTKMLVSSRLKVVIVFHINHANEIDPAFKEAIKPLKENGVTLLNQSVLLKAVNDDASILAQLSEALFEADIMPYYLHLLDKVSGASHFDIEESQAIAIVKQLATIVPGFLMPRLVREIGGEPNKTPINLA